MNQTVTEISLQLELLIVQIHQLAAGKYNQASATYRINKQHQGQLVTDSPQYNYKTDKSEQSRYYLNCDTEAGASKTGRVL